MQYKSPNRNRRKHPYKGVIIDLHQFQDNQFQGKNWKKHSEVKRIDRIGFSLNYEVVHIKYSMTSLDDNYIEKVFQKLAKYFDENWVDYEEMYLVFSKWGVAKKVIEETLFNRIERGFTKETLKSLTEQANEKTSMKFANFEDRATLSSTYQKRDDEVAGDEVDPFCFKSGHNKMSRN